MINKAFILAATLGFGFSNAAMALDNGDFSAELNGWQSLGDSGPSAGAALLTTASLDYADDFPSAVGAFNVSGLSAELVGEADGVEEFAGLAIGALDLGNFAFEGSVLKQGFSVQAGDSLSFDWNFFSNEGVSGFQNFAFVSIDGELTQLATAVDAGMASNSFAWESGVATFSLRFDTGGYHTLALGVVDVGDYAVSSALWVDNVVLTPVPEPETWSMVLIGLGLIFTAIRRHHPTHHNRIGEPQNA